MIRDDFSAEKALKWLGWYYMKEVELRGCTFVKTEKLRTQITKIADKICNDDKWGLFIMGQVGNGKTTMLKAIRNMINHLIREDYFAGETTPWSWVEMMKARDIPDLYIENKPLFREKMNRDWLIIDDLGVEAQEVMVYGNKCYPILEMLDYRYEYKLPTIITSNLKSDEIKEKYGDPRFSDRFNQMFNKITFRDKSFR